MFLAVRAGSNAGGHGAKKNGPWFYKIWRKGLVQLEGKVFVDRMIAVRQLCFGGIGKHIDCDHYSKNP